MDEITLSNDKLKPLMGFQNPSINKMLPSFLIGCKNIAYDHKILFLRRTHCIQPWVCST